MLIYQGTTLATEKERKDFIYKGDNQWNAQVNLIYSWVLYSLSLIAGIATLVYGYYYKNFLDLFYIGIIGPMYALNIRALLQLISSMSYI
jgi:hypothetical protein